MGNLFAINSKTKKANYITIYEIENTPLALDNLFRVDAKNEEVDYIIIYEIEKHLLLWSNYLLQLLRTRRAII